MSESTMNDSIRDDELLDEALDRSGAAKGSGIVFPCVMSRTKSVD